MELNHLRHFYFVAKEGGFSKAANRLRVAQSSVSISIRKLEGSLGFAVFERSYKAIRLTKRGNDIFRKCEIIFAQIDDITKSSRQVPLELTGNLNIGAAEGVGSTFMPVYLTSLLKNHPKIYPHITVGTAAEVFRLLRAKSVDVGILFHAPNLPDDLEVYRLIPIEHYLVVGRKYKSNRSVCSSFIGSREVDDVGNKNYPTLKKLQKIYPEASIKISTNSLSAHRQMVNDGLGCSILPYRLVANEIKSKKFSVLLAKEQFVFNMKIVVRRGEPASAVVEALIKRCLLAESRG